MMYKIGELAKETGFQAGAIRYYEKEGLLPAPERSGGNYRLYSDADARRLRFIRHCRLHGIRLQEIRALLAFKENPEVSCAWIGRLIEKHLASVDAQIAELKHLKEHLQALARSCTGDKGGDCAILTHICEEECRCCQKFQTEEGAPPQRKSPA